jgi:ribosomal RNA-processing protein 1
VELKQSENQESNGQEDDEAGTSTMAKSTEKSAKKVRFSMKNNLIWKPSTPLPPQSLRIPPSVTPRGSALKKGIPPGPVREMPAKKNMKQRAKSMKKVIKGISPATKRVKKLKSLAV